MQNRVIKLNAFSALITMYITKSIQEKYTLFYVWLLVLVGCSAKLRAKYLWSLYSAQRNGL